MEETEEPEAQFESAIRTSEFEAALPSEDEELLLALRMSMGEGRDVPPSAASLAPLSGTGAQKVTAVTSLGSIAPLHAEVDSRTGAFRNVGASCYINSMLQAVFGVAEVLHVQPWDPFVRPWKYLFHVPRFQFRVQIHLVVLISPNDADFTKRELLALHWRRNQNFPSHGPCSLVVPRPFNVVCVRETSFKSPLKSTKVRQISFQSVGSPSKVRESPLKVRQQSVKVL